MSFSSIFFTASAFLKYYFTASNGRGHGIHSPFVYAFVRDVLMDRRRYYAYEQVEELRERLLKDASIINVEDMGAGSMLKVTSKRTIASIAKYAAKPKKFGQLLFRVVNQYQYKNILELGTSLGITSSYLSLAALDGHVYTLEGAEAIAQKAQENFHHLGLQHVALIQGNFDQTLPALLQLNKKYDLVFVDGNHRKEPTIRYFQQIVPHLAEKSVIVFDDIHWSREMQSAWEEIKKDPRVMLSVDLFFVGLIFFDASFKVSQHFRIRF